MQRTLSARTCRLLDIQGFDHIDRQRLAEVAPWLRLAFGLCTLPVAVGTAVASPIVLLTLVPIATLAAAFPVHPFDLIYNHGLRHLTGTGPLPKRGAPARFACGMAAVWLPATAWAFASGRMVLGYSLGAALVAVGTLVSTTDICIPSMLFRLVFGQPAPREEQRAP